MGGGAAQLQDLGHGGEALRQGKRDYPRKAMGATGQGKVKASPQKPAPYWIRGREGAEGRKENAESGR
jgi:hypothetical protein